MEEGHLRKIITPLLERETTQKAIEVLQEQVDKAEEIRDLKAAESPLVRAAIKVIEGFLKKTGRVCYGGQAINAHLPKQLKFYDPKKTIPDYDVYTPTLEKDVRTVLSLLRKEGFPEVAHREGLHEGTMKISVAYNDILDLTAMDPEIYSVLFERSVSINNIRYADANFLRSNMYKELSQPEGEIDRWEKVYTRLVLLNEAVPVHECNKSKEEDLTPIKKELYQQVFEFLVTNQRILAGANLGQIYRKRTKNYSWLLEDTTVPIIFYSPNPENDSVYLQSLIGDGFKTEIFEAHSDTVPACISVYDGNTLVAIIIEEGACYSYNRVNIFNSQELHVASLDTAIRLFYQLSLLRGFPFVAERSIYCIANNLVELSMKIRAGAVQTGFPLFSIECSGHQPTKGSLVRAKRLRAKLRKQGVTLTRKKKTRSLKAQ